MHGMAVSMHHGRGGMDQRRQGGGLNDARNILALLCRKMVGLKINAHWILCLVWFCPPTARQNGRKNLPFEFGQNILWVKCHNYLTSVSIFGLPSWSGLVNFKIGENLVSVIRFHFGMLKIRIWKWFCKLGKHHFVHFHVLLDSGQKDIKVRFRK